MQTDLDRGQIWVRERGKKKKKKLEESVKWTQTQRITYLSLSIGIKDGDISLVAQNHKKRTLLVSVVKQPTTQTFNPMFFRAQF